MALKFKRTHKGETTITYDVIDYGEKIGSVVRVESIYISFANLSQNKPAPVVIEWDAYNRHGAVIKRGLRTQAAAGGHVKQWHTDNTPVRMQ